MDSEETVMVNLINAYRSSTGLPILTVSPALTAAAAWKSTDLATNGYFAHDDPSRSWNQRFADCGYASPNIAETLAAGNASAAATFEQWRTSAEHNANLLSPSMRALGVARAYQQGSPYGWYWTAEFGAVVDSSAPASPTAAPPAAAAVPAGAASAPASGALPSTSAPAAPPATAAVAPAPSRVALGVGATAIVSGTGDCLRVHAAPSLDSDAVDCLVDGTGMVVADGPVSADGYTWWKLANLGWVVDQYLTALPGPQGPQG
jgi:uncharacterized protein YkwD